jgi:glycosyltransferase involved in cell wall biosynthesis
MKIAHVVDTLEIGGAERLVVTMAEIQRARGHSVEVHCVIRSGPLATELQRLGVAIYENVATSTVGRIRALATEFRRTRPDVVHLHNATAAIYGSIAAFFAGVPGRISTRHGLVPHKRNSSTEMKFWMTARLTDFAVAVSHQTRENMLSFPLADRNKLRVIVNGCAPAASNGHATLLRSPAFTFIHVARLNAVKDQSTLLRAFALATQELGNVRLLIGGDGPKRRELEELAADLKIRHQVVFAGMREDIGDWLAASDCFVLSSISEATPVSLLEAMAAGLPCIVTHVGEMPAIVGDAACGWIVPPGSPEQLAAAMLRALASDHPLLQNLGARARKAYSEHYSAETMTDRYLDLYQQALERE